MPFALYAQQSDERYELDRTIALPGKHAGGIFMKAYNYTHGNSVDFYVVNNGAEPKYEQLPDSYMGNGMSDMLGYVDFNRGKGLVRASGLFVYEPKDTNGCMQLVVIACDVEIRCVKGEADVTITNLRYCNYKRNSDRSDVLRIGNAQQQEPGKGRYERLLASNVCPEEMAALKTFVQNAGNEMLDRIDEGMGGAQGKLKEIDW
ncbi:MAG: hypothetical protein ACTHJ0_03375 [Flavipsychrobacter sp.]